MLGIHTLNNNVSFVTNIVVTCRRVNFALLKLLIKSFREQAIKTIGDVGGEEERVPAFLGYASYIGHKRLFR